MHENAFGQILKNARHMHQNAIVRLSVCPFVRPFVRLSVRPSIRGDPVKRVRTRSYISYVFTQRLCSTRTNKLSGETKEQRKYRMHLSTAKSKRGLFAGARESPE